MAEEFENPREEAIEKQIEKDLKEIEKDAHDVEHLRAELAEEKRHHKHDFEVVIDGKPYEVKFGEKETVKALIEEALKLSGNAGRAASEWQLKYDGRTLDESAKIESLGIPTGATLFLSLRAGVLG